MLTVRDAPEDLKEALRAGVNDLMGKPFRFGELVDRIRSLTSGSPDRRVARAWRRPASVCRRETTAHDSGADMKR